MFYEDKLQIKIEEERLESLRLKSFRKETKKASYFKSIERKMVTAFGVVNYKLNIYCYYKKRKRITYTVYHDKKLKNLKRKKYDPAYIACLISQKYQGILRYSRNDKKASLQLVNFYAQHYKKNFQNFSGSENENAKIPKQKVLTINVDDSYLKVKVENRLRKMRFRMFNITIRNKEKIIKNVLIYEPHYFEQYYTRKNKFQSEKTSIENLQYYSAKIKQTISKYKIDYDTIRICSDSARWMKQLAKLNNWEHQLDNFHFQRNLLATFGSNKTIFKRNKIAFEHYTDKYGVHIYKQTKMLVQENEPDKLIEFVDELLNSKCIFHKTKIKELEKFKKFIKNNFQSIKLTYAVNRIPTTAESSIYHYFKKYFKQAGVPSYENVIFTLKHNENEKLKYCQI